MDKTVYLNVAAIRREALAQSTLAPLPQQAFEGGTSWRARNEQLDPAAGLAAVQEDPEEGSDACCAKELLPASAGPQGRTCSLPLPQVHSSDVRCRQSENIGEAQAPRAAEGLSWRQKLLARLGTGHSSSHPDTPHRQRHFICDGSTAAIPESNSVSADHVLLKNASTCRLMHGGHDPHQHGSTIPGYSPCAGGDGESHRHHRHYHHHHHHHQRHPHPHPHQQHYQQKYQQQHRQAQQHVPMAPAASRSSPVPAAGAAAAAESGAVSPRGGCHLVPLLSAADVQLAMQALQSAAWIHDYVWNSVDPATCGASPRTSSGGGGGNGGGGGGGSSRSNTRRREALAAIATPVYREALAAVSRIQHPALHSLVHQAVAFYVDPVLGEPEDVLRIILELLTACGGMPAAATPPPPSARAAAPAPQSRSLSGGGGGSGKDRPGPAVAAAGAAAVAAGRVSESGSSVVTVPSCRSLGGARRISSSCRASPLATEAAPRSCTALGAGLRRETCGAATGGVEGRAVSSASAVGEAAGGGIRGFGLRRKVAERFLSRSDGSSSSSSSSSSTTSEAALSMGSSLASLGVCTNGSVATASGGGAAMAAAALHSCGSGVALHSASEGAPPGPNSGNDNLQSDLVVTDASYTASAPTSAVIPAAAGAASYTSAASPTCVPAGGNADGSGHSSSRRAASLQGSEHITIPSGSSSGGGNGGGACASGGAARALRLSLHGLRDVFRSHHNSPAREARENSSVGSGSRSEVRGFPARAAMALDDSGGKGPASDHHHHHYHRLLSLFRKSGTAAH